jgi:hypothetical protein
MPTALVFGLAAKIRIETRMAGVKGKSGGRLFELIPGK